MQTNFTLAQLADADVAESEKILRSCVHCGFCTATCPTYVLLGDELDSPRGRIYLIKDMLENDRPAGGRVVTHVDRCLSCLSCMTTCPSGVHYMHLVDHARRHIEETHTRPRSERWRRRVLAHILPRPRWLRAALFAAGLGRLVRPLLPASLAPWLALAPRTVPKPSTVHRPQVFAAEGQRRARVALLAGCTQLVLAPDINDATVRLLRRRGAEVVVARGAGCCGALVHHLGMAAPAHAQAAANIDAWWREIERGGLDAIVVNTSGCGTMLRDYGHVFRDDPAYAEKAARISELAKDVTEVVASLGLGEAANANGQRVAYQSPCSMQHGQGIRLEPVSLLRDAGFEVVEPAEAHMCCGSAGTYNLLQSELATRLRDRKIEQLEALTPQIIATGNIGCMAQLAAGTGIPVVHTISLLDWASGGPKPEALPA